MKRLILALVLLCSCILFVGVGHARLAAQDAGITEGMVAGQFSPSLRFGEGPAPALRELLDAVRAL